MRLWSQQMIRGLDRQRLLGQHRECCALRGKGWGKKHSVINYVFNYNPAYLVAYHCLVMNEMERRGYRPDPVWKDFQWRGSTLGREEGWAHEGTVIDLLGGVYDYGEMIFEEHNGEYLKECIENLEQKGVKYPYDA